MQTGPYGKESIHSANLYQILAYTKNADFRRDGSTSGMLLYARTTADGQPDLDAVIQDNRIGARTLDLTLPWEHLRRQLEDVLTWLKHRSRAVGEGDFPTALRTIAIAGISSIPAPRPTALCSTSAVPHLPSSASPSYAI